MEGGRYRSQLLFTALVVVALIGLTVFVYSPGLHGLFVFDSVERVVRNDSLQISSISAEQLLGAAYAGQVNYPERGLAYTSLALNYYLSGQRFDPFTFKLTNLIIHILNGLLVVIFARMIMGRWWGLGILVSRRDPPTYALILAFIAACIWVLHPIQLTSVLYVVQRMTSLAATWVLAGAILFIFARSRLQQGRSHALALMYGSVVVCTGAGFLCKENALLLPAFIAVLELFLFDRRALAPAHKRQLMLYFGLTLLLPMLVGVATILTSAELSVDRDFDMLQRVLTQARVLFFYLGLLIVPNIRRFGLYHDDIIASAGILDPWTTLVAVVAWIVVIIFAVWGGRRRAPWAFAVCWFVVGHAMESTILPLELVHEHRNYVPSVGIWVALAYYSGAAWNGPGRLGTVVLPAMFAWVLVLTLTSHMRADSWRSPGVLMEALARNHPESYRSASGYAFNSIPVTTDLSVRFDAFRRAATLNHQVVSPLIEMAKIASALDSFMSNGERATSSSSGEGDGMHIADMQLLADSDQNSGLSSALDREINRRLGDERVRIDNIIALVSVVDCSLEGSIECISLRDNARRWHVSALSNERLPAVSGAVLELSLAKLHAVAGEYDESVRHAQLAGKLAADNLAYRLQEAILYALLERWKELGDVLNDIEVRFPVRATSDATFLDLWGQYDRARD